tara:strand:- start:6996 stop:7166 length:171 start_codon:yes stop_codon:yes gene_type:complete
MTLNSIKKIRIPRKLKKRRKSEALFGLEGASFKYIQEVELKEKYRYSKDDLEHLFV